MKLDFINLLILYFKNGKKVLQILTINGEKLIMTLSHNEQLITINLWETGGLAVTESAALDITAS